MSDIGKKERLNSKLVYEFENPYNYWYLKVKKLKLFLGFGQAFDIKRYRRDVGTCSRISSVFKENI